MSACSWEELPSKLNLRVLEILRTSMALRFLTEVDEGRDEAGRGLRFLYFLSFEIFSDVF